MNPPKTATALNEYQSWMSCPHCKRPHYYDEQACYGKTYIISCYNCGSILSFNMSDIQHDKSGGPFVSMPFMQCLHLPQS